VNAYKLNFNDFSGFLSDNWSTQDLNAIFWVIFFISSIMNPIVLLNMLIAIMSDTYDRVQEDQVVADCKEMAGLIMQAEGMIFWRRKMSKKGYLQRCDYVRHLTSETTEWMGKIRAIKKSIARLNLKSRSNDRKINQMQNKVLIKIKELKGINESISKKITDMEGTNNSNKSSSSFIL
jgi:sigma54-dependent transcription regulator